MMLNGLFFVVTFFDLSIHERGIASNKIFVSPFTFFFVVNFLKPQRAQRRSRIKQD